MRREGVPACEPVGESWWCRLKEKMDYLWDRASACILTINHQTPDGDGDFTITGGDGITVTGEDNGIRIEATITEETVEGIVGQEAAARQQSDQALKFDIDAEKQARMQVDQTLQQAIDAKASASDVTALGDRVTAVEEKNASQDTEISALESDKADKAQLDEYVMKDQGIENAGKALVIGSDGIVAPGNAGGGGDSAIWGEITGNIANQADLQAELNEKADTSTVTVLSGRVNTLETDVGVLESDITTLESDVNGKADSSAVSALTTRVSAIEGDVSNLNTGTVKTTGDQTIAGVKTFTANLDITGNWPYLQNTDSDADITTPPSAWRRNGGLLVRDKNHRGIGAYDVCSDASGVVYSRLESYNVSETGEDISAVFQLRALRNGTTYATAPTPPATANSTEIATANWVKSRIKVSDKEPTASDGVDGDIWVVY